MTDEPRPSQPSDVPLQTYFVEPSLRERAKQWISEHREDIIDQALAEQAREEEVSS